MSERTKQDESEFGDVLKRLSDAVDEVDDSSEQSEPSGEWADSNGEIGVRDARDAGRALAKQLTGSPLDGIVEVKRIDEEGWRVVVEVVERNSIPDTQDILGRYVISLDGDGGVRGYGRAGRYRRASFGHQREAIDADENDGYE